MDFNSIAPTNLATPYRLFLPPCYRLDGQSLFVVRGRLTRDFHHARVTRRRGAPPPPPPSWVLPGVSFFSDLFAAVQLFVSSFILCRNRGNGFVEPLGWPLEWPLDRRRDHSRGRSGGDRGCGRGERKGGCSGYHFGGRFKGENKRIRPPVGGLAPRCYTKTLPRIPLPPSPLLPPQDGTLSTAVAAEAGLVQGLTDAETFFGVQVGDLGTQVEAGLRTLSETLAAAAPKAGEAPPERDAAGGGAERFTLAGVHPTAAASVSSVIASALALSAADGGARTPPPTEGELAAYGITAELREFVAGLTVRTWRDFPLSLSVGEPGGFPGWSLSLWQEQHAQLALQSMAQLSDFRYVLVPRRMPDTRFWQIYFLLTASRLAPFKVREGGERGGTTRWCSKAPRCIKALRRRMPPPACLQGAEPLDIWG